MSFRATLVSTRHFDARIHALLDVDEQAEMEDALASHPEAHPVVQGTGGVRKMRWARAGMGKSGGIRVIYYYVTSAGVVGLITVYAKAKKETLSNADKDTIRKIAEGFEKHFSPAYRAR